MAALPRWLDAIESGEVEPRSVGVIVKEHTATAVLDGRRGLAPWILAHAARIAGEKAREVGVGMVRVVGIGRIGATAEVVSEIAVGPMVGTIAGPSGEFAIAVPVEGSMPAVFDSALAGESTPTLPAWAFEALGGWLVTARAVSAFESLAGIHEHAGVRLSTDEPLRGEIRPDAWQARRLEHLARGLELAREVEATLRDRASRNGLGWPK